MLEFELLSIDGDARIYEYYPEGDRGDPGRVRYEPKGQEFEIELLPKADEFRHYFFHLASRLRESAGDDLPADGMCAWY